MSIRAANGFPRFGDRMGASLRGEWPAALIPRDDVVDGFGGTALGAREPERGQGREADPGGRDEDGGAQPVGGGGAQSGLVDG